MMRSATLLLSACFLSVVPFVILSESGASESVALKGKEYVRHFRDYASAVKTLKISTLSTDIEGISSSNAEIRYNAVFDFVEKRKKTLYHRGNNGAQLTTEELFVAGNPLVLYHGEKMLETHSDGIQLVLQKVSGSRWAEVVCLQFLGNIFFRESEKYQVAFWDVVDDMAVRDVREERLESGEDIVTIILSSDKRKVELSLIPSKKWAPHAIFWEQEPFSPEFPSVRSTKLVYSDHTLVSNHWIPMSCIVEMSFPSASRTTSDGRKFELPPMTSKSRLDIADIVVNPSLSKEDFYFSIPIPDFTPVIVEDESKKHIKHVWLDGKVVPWTDETALAYARGHKFMPGPEEPRFWMMAIGIILILIGGRRLAYKYFTK